MVMASVVRRLARLLAVAFVIGATITPAQTPSAGQTPVAGLYPEVRLRKLHLVRPDLILYPISYEVCC
jgi:hypothetical protein